MPYRDTDPPIMDEERLEEIALLTRLMIEATGRCGPLSTSEVDELLATAG